MESAKRNARIQVKRQGQNCCYKGQTDPFGYAATGKLGLVDN